jgi:hypothetical protein
MARAPLFTRAFLLVVTVGFAVGPAARVNAGGNAKPAAAAASRASLLQDAAWIEKAARSDGAIATNPDQRLVWPYLANFAAMGLARAAAIGDRRAADTAWRWLAWYQAHEDAHGYVDDYQRVGIALRSNGTMDSTDAYAGTFLLAVESVFQATGDHARLNSLRRGIEGAVRAIESTQAADGLTWAKPSWHVKYLMDQAETYAGLVAAANLGDALRAPKLEAHALSDARRMHAGVARLWNPRVGAYDWAVHGDGARASTNWSVLYPDAMQQAWAVAFGVLDGTRAHQLLATLTRMQPQWATPTAIATIGSARTRVGYWAAATWALRREGTSPAARIHSIRHAALSANRAWPFTSGVAGQLMVAEAAPLAPQPKPAPKTTAIVVRSDAVMVRPKLSVAATSSPSRGQTRWSWSLPAIIALALGALTFGAAGPGGVLTRRRDAADPRG